MIQEYPAGPDTTSLQLAIRQHLKDYWPSRQYSEKSWPAGPILRSIPSFRVAVMPPIGNDAYFFYCTIGCSTTEQGEHIRHEFFILSPLESEKLVQTLAMLSNFHADDRYKLDVGKIVKVGEPWLDGSSCDHFFISLPYTLGPTFEWLKLGPVCVRFLWVLPITSREAAYAELKGHDSLEEKFDRSQLDYLNVSRDSVV